MFFLFIEEKCAKSIECQTEDNTFVDCKSSFTEEINETKSNECVTQKTSSDQTNATNSQTNGDMQQNINYQNQNINNNNRNINNNNQNINNQPQNQSPISVQNAPILPPVNGFDDRRQHYGSDQMYSSVVSNGQMLFQSPYNNYSMNPMMSQNFMPPMSPMMSGYPPMAGPMFPMNPMQNMYSSPYAQSLNGSQTGLDRLGYRSNSISSEQSFVNPMAPQYGSRYSSCENLPAMSPLNDKNQQKSQFESGLHLVQALREAERNGFTADDLEVAINFSPEKPLG